MNEQASEETRIEVAHDPERQQYTISVDGVQAGFASYRRLPDRPDSSGSTLDFEHTVVDPSFEGRGLGSALIAGAVDDVRSRGDRIVPTCPFVAVWFRKHPEFGDVLAD
ncbi:GNAT family N-acetyltransferase [Leucobacter sp. GX24907]